MRIIRTPARQSAGVWPQVFGYLARFGRYPSANLIQEPALAIIYGDISIDAGIDWRVRARRLPGRANGLFLFVSAFWALSCATGGLL